MFLPQNTTIDNYEIDPREENFIAETIWDDKNAQDF